MDWSKRWIVASILGCILLTPIGAAADDLMGPITTTRTITTDSRLIGDVTCMVTGAPCIAFGAPHISLRLNGFTITGQADPNTACGGAIQANEQGISSNNQANIEIRGPGVVQRFRADGVLFVGTQLGKIEGVTTTTNCQSGIRVTATASRISIAGNISVRNGSTNAGAACGGI